MKKIIPSILFIVSFAAFCKAQGTLQFNQVLLVTSVSASTVPVGKVWKVVNAFAPSSVRIIPSGGSGTCTGSCNGANTQWTNFTVSGACPSSTDPQIKIGGNAVNFTASSPLWLPAGTTVQGNTATCNQQGGFFSNQGFSCFCPLATTSFTLSIIEFNVNP